MRELRDILAEINVGIEEACRKSGRSPDEVEIVAVTKTHGEDVVREAWEAGLGIVGENKVQEAAWKKAASVSGPAWHLIGHLQKNKVRAALGIFDFIHSVDSAELVERIDRTAEEMGASPHILFEVNVSGEASKSGMAPSAVAWAVETVMERCPRVTLEGFMTMAPFVPPDKVEETRGVFAALRELRDRTESAFGISLPRLSMGMSGDWRVAVEEGATWIRLGTVLFGERPKLRAVRAVADGGDGDFGAGGGLDSYSGAGPTVRILD